MANPHLKPHLFFVAKWNRWACQYRDDVVVGPFGYESLGDWLTQLAKL